MPWTKANYPRSMKNLRKEVRDKAIEIANAMIEDGKMEEGYAIATATSRAKDWAANRDKPVKKKNAETKETDVKQHGEDTYVSPAENGWEVKKEGNKRGKKFDAKAEAVSYAKEQAKKANAAVTIQRKDGKLEKRISYNPNRRFRKVTGTRTRTRAR